MRPLSPLTVLLSSLLLGCPPAPVEEDPTPAPSTLREQPEFCGEVTPLVQPSAIGFRTETEHYVLDLALDEEEATELARLAETAWAAFGSYFPGDIDDGGGQLEAFVDATEAAWADRIAADGLGVPWGAGGFFHPATNRAYLYAQPTVYYTRQLFLHELGHQLHAAARTSSDPPAWYVEGTAEFLSRHDWDGRCVRLGVVPLLTFEDMPADAVDDLDAEALDLPYWVDDVGFPGRPLMLELFRYFETHTQRAPGWLAVRDAFDAGEAPDAQGIADLLGVDSLADIEDPFDAFVRQDPEPLEPIWLEWQHRTPTSVRGWSLGGAMSVARIKEPAQTLSVTVDSPSVMGGASGLLVAWDSADEHTAILVGGDGGVSRWHVSGGQVQWTDLGAIPAPGSDPVALAITGSDPGEARFSVNGSAFSVPVTARPGAGLAVYDSDVLFDDLVRGTP